MIFQPNEDDKELTDRLLKRIKNNIRERTRLTEEEFEEHRKTALEREQKVRRQLQDEINKQKNDS